MWLGRYALGDWIPLSVLTATAARVATRPTQRPTASIFSSSALVATHLLPIKDRYRATSLFQRQIQLTSSYSAGYYSIVYQAVVGSDFTLEVDTFSIVAGGDAAGAVIGLAHLQRPEADHLLIQLDGGTLRTGRNPQ